jgi:hypothetical protein
MDMKQQFLSTASLETISFETLSSVFPDRDFRKAIFPLWVTLRDAGYRQSVKYRLPPTKIDDGLTNHLFRSTLILSFKQARDASIALTAHGVYDHMMAQSLDTALPPLPVRSIQR